jgi:hypothetical protein
VGKILHHFAPLLRESLLKKEINKIICSIIFLFLCHGGFVGHARVIVLNIDKIKTQLAILKPRWGHAIKIDQEKPTLIALILIIF